MASSKEFTDYVVDQLGGTRAIECKKLFGEYGLWRGGKFFGTVEEDQLYVKITEAGSEMMPDAKPVAPHGGKPGMYLVEELDDRDFLRELVRRTCEALPAPGSKRKKEYNETGLAGVKKKKQKRQMKKKILLIAGSTHVGKTLAAQRVLEKYSYPYLSIDHLKMGLIRGGICSLTPESSGEVLTSYLWNIVREIIKTAIENSQNLVIEGCYIPFDWKKDFEREYLEQIRYVCLIFSENYIQTHYNDIMNHANAIEKRMDDTYCTQELLLKENRNNLEQCRRYGCDYILIDGTYEEGALDIMI